MTPEMMRALLASGKAEELMSGADLFTIAFALAGRRLLSVDEAIDTLLANGLSPATPRPELADRIRRGTRSDATFVLFNSESFVLDRRADLSRRLVEVLLRKPVDQVRRTIRQTYNAKKKALRSRPRPKPPARPPPPLPLHPEPPPPPAPPPLSQATVTFAELDASGVERSLAGPWSPPDAVYQVLRARAERQSPPEDQSAAVTAPSPPQREGRAADTSACAPVTSVRLDVDPPRPGHARSAAGRFVVRNAAWGITQVSMGRAIYVAAAIRYAVEADERRDGLAWVILSATDGAAPEAAVGTLLDLAWSDGRVRPIALPAGAASAARLIPTRVEARVRAAVAPLLAEVARRHAGAYERTALRSGALITAAQSPWPPAEPVAVEAKVADLVTRRDNELRDLEARFAARVTSSLAAWVFADVPVALVSVRLRRRKEERELLLRVPAAAEGPDRPACEGCGALTARPAVCDLRLHLLCEACAPIAQRKCPACVKLWRPGG